MTEQPITAGYYRHYKGGLYEVLGIAQHSETLEPLVVYRPCYGERGLWVRPLEMFAGVVTHAGWPQPRFERLEHDPRQGEPAP